MVRGLKEERKWPQIKREVYIACPVCFSGNSFQIDEAEGDLTCADCGFLLAENLGRDISESEECIFCESSYIYFESLIELFSLGRASICYVCEARYKGIRIDHPDEKYSEEGAQSARSSWASLRWNERVKGYKA